MNNFIGVGSASLSYRLLPRILVLLFFSILLFAVSFISFSFLKVPNYLLISFAISIGFFALFGLIVYLTAYLEYSNLKYLIEDNAILLKQGVFNVDTETIPYQKIRNASFTQNFIQRLYGVGNVIIDQDPETYIWESIDNKTAQTIIEAVSNKSNIQPIAVSEGEPNPYQVK